MFKHSTGLKILGLGAVLLVAFPLVLLYLATEPFANLPEIGENLPEKITEANDVFKKRVTSAYPVGTDEAQMRKKLEAEGFVVGSYQEKGKTKYGAEYRWGMFPCSWKLFIFWQTEHGKVSDIDGAFHDTCL